MRPTIQTFACHCRPLTRRVGGALLLLAAVALFAFPANGITPAPTTAATAGPDGFSQADTNQDGKLSRDEASDYLVIEIFISRDANHDGRMTLEEWVGGDPTRSADFKKRDTNEDGIVTTKEAIAYGRAHGVVNQIMQEADTNHDGALSRAEIKAYYASREGPPN
jgi:EF hand